MQMLKNVIAGIAVAALAAGPVAGAAAPAEPAIVEAASSGNADAVTALLDRGVDPDAVRADGRTALMEAARLGRYDIVRALLVRGATKALTDRAGRTAFDFALSGQHSDIIALLRDAS